MMDKKISYFYRANSPANPQDITIQQFIELIKGETMKRHCDKLRSVANKEERQEYKRQHLPGATLAGTFSYRNKKSFKAPSGFAMVDFDIYTEKSEEIRKNLEKDPYIAILFTSPSGGQKAIVRIPPVKDDAQYQQVYVQVIEYYKEMHASTDEANKDISRLCYLSYDPNVLINEKASVFPVDWNKKTEQKTLQTTDKTPALTEDGRIDRSRVEFRKLISLIRNKLQKGKNVEDIRQECYIEMRAYQKWNTDTDHYRQWQFTKALEYALTKEQESEIELIDLKEAINKGVPKISYIIDPFLREGGLTIIGGEPGAKKSLLAMMMSISIAKGTPLFDKYECQKKKVCYLDFENGYLVMVNRFSNLLWGNYAGNKDDIENISLSIFNDIKIDNKKGKLAIEEIIEKTGADIFIIDSLVRCMEGEEDKATDVRKVFDNLKDFMAEGKSFIILHHTRKDSGRGMQGLRGSSDLGGMAEIVLMLYSQGEKNKFTNCQLGKHRHMGLENAEDWGFMVDTELFEGKSDYLKLKHYLRDPDQQSKYEECVADIEQWIDENYKAGEKFKTKACTDAMDKLGGYSRQMVQKGLNEEVTKGILRKSEKRGVWIVQ